MRIFYIVRQKKYNAGRKKSPWFVMYPEENLEEQGHRAT